MAFVTVNIGSNLGNRRLNLSRAMRGIAERFGDFEMSHAVESKPWGFDSTLSFLNIGISFHSDLQPHEILHELQEIERSISDAPHRNPDGTYADRAVDIDIITVDRDIISTDTLRVPHPHLAERSFFLEPLEELAPGWTHPETGKTPREMIDDLNG